MLAPPGARHALRSLVLGLPCAVQRRLLFAYFNHRLPRFGSPVAFNDKVNWRILNDRRPVLEWTCDKLAAKDYAAHAAIPGLNIPRTVWSGSDIRDLRSVTLPDHWVLKPNHRSGLVYFGNGSPDYDELVNRTSTWLDMFQSSKLGEWAYSTARPLLLIEELLGEPGAPPPDYKFYVFDGQVAVVVMDVNRYSEHTRRPYLPDWSPLDVQIGPNKIAPIAPPPKNLKKMVQIAGQLGRPFDYIRVDLYEVQGRIEFGELTPYPGGGLDRFVPPSFEIELGEKWKLPKL